MSLRQRAPAQVCVDTFAGRMLTLLDVAGETWRYQLPRSRTVHKLSKLAVSWMAL